MALLSPDYSITQEPICRTNEHAHAPRISTHGGEKQKDGVKEEEYLLILADSAEFASRLAPLVEVDKLDGARVSESPNTRISLVTKESMTFHPVTYHPHDTH